MNEVPSQPAIARNRNNGLDELRGRFAQNTSKDMRFGFFEVPTHIHTFDESLARCARRSNSTSLSRGKLLRCRHAVKTDYMKDKFRLGFFVVGSLNGYIKARI